MPDDRASDWSEAGATNLDAGSSRTALLALLRAEGAPATAAVCIPRGSTEAVISSLARGLVELLSTEQRRCGGLRALPDSPGDDFFGQDGEASVDDCPLPDLPGAVRLASPRWLQSAVEAVGQLMPRGAACLRFEAGNGRIGLMLRRCPPLLATVRLPDIEHLGCSSEGDDQLSSLLRAECRRAALMLTLRKAFEAEAAALDAEYAFLLTVFVSVVSTRCSECSAQYTSSRPHVGVFTTQAAAASGRKPPNETLNAWVFTQLARSHAGGLVESSDERPQAAVNSVSSHPQLCRWSPAMSSSSCHSLTRT